ncbi:MAG: Wzz/FepE/Etk N-terminal domain-containing protein [Geminicoccaceae bacterium]|nr:Wzz/FepE/Etk N-terminal domain-containing protein [Geminicoccaceae bacterium]
MNIPSPQQAGLGLRDYLTILRRRTWLFAIPTVLVLAGAIAFALLQTPIYRSEATILIEDADIPEDLVTTLVGDYIEKRLEAIDRRVMVTSSLLEIIDRYGLYVEERRTEPVSAIVEEMRENIGRRMIRADVVDPRSGAEREVTVAFELSFEHPSAETAQRITNELVSLYLSQNLRQRQELATETADFFQSERARAEQRISELEERLADFKQANAGSLPDQLPYTQQIIGRAEQELRELTRDAQSLREREGYLQSQLVLAEPMLRSDNGSYRTPTAALLGKRAEYATLSARYGPDHPDIVKLEREIGALERATGAGPSVDGLEGERSRLSGELEELRQRYGDDHPDVRRAERALAGVEASLRQAKTSPSSAQPAADNPAYIQLETDLNAVRAELAAIQAQREAVAEKLDRHQEMALKTPLVEREYGQLRRALDDAMALREELARKETTAALGQTLEAELKAERLSLIEPASLPLVPVKPNRTRIALIGLVLGLGLGGGLVGLAQSIDDGVYAKDVTAIVGEAPLSIVPRIMTLADQRRHRVAVAAVVLVVAGGLGAAAWWVHSRYLPLDIAYYDLQRWVRASVEPYVANASEEPPAAVDGQ